MKGVVLAAGRGSRLGALTERRPKCLVPLAGRPLLAWQRAALSAAGVRDHVVVVGYRAEQIAATGVPVLHAPRWSGTNMVRSLLAAQRVLASEPCVVAYGDLVYSAQAVRRLLAAPEGLALTYDPGWLRLWSRRFPDPLEDAETFRLAEDGVLGDIGGTPTGTDEVQGQYMGLLRSTPADWEVVRRRCAALAEHELDALDMTGLLRLLLRDGVPIRAVACPEPWGEVDSATDLALYERDPALLGVLRSDHDADERGKA